ncbi:Dual specificity protein phosphatase 7 [Acropora cervicornis]|uniref:Dual specificity protein phosphatase 7 n=1 Tax=Acropora cervicornis TaxID=6130 RepID=A0AAD9V5J6_ACRCE|nr:Dual specificity protein phosphatase 7 [Acropora cervicornis]
MPPLLLEPRHSGSKGGCMNRVNDMSSSGKWKCVSPRELAERLSDSEEDVGTSNASDNFLLVDCRSLVAFNGLHIRGAIHVNCTGIGRKRLSQGKAKLKDLISSAEGKQKFISGGVGTTFVIYDDLSNGPDDDCNPCRPICLVLQTLLKEGKNISVLKVSIYTFLLHDTSDETGEDIQSSSICEINAARFSTSLALFRFSNDAELPGLVVLDKPLRGLKEFCRDYQNLCENAPVNVCHVTDFPPSPTPATTCDSHAGRPQGAPVTAILPLLYLGNEEGAADEALIDRLSIKYILNLTPRCPNFFSQRSDMHYKQIKINDSNQEDIEQHFDEAIQFIDEAREQGSGVLVHCHAGVSRSATVTVAYIMRKEGMCLTEAYKFVKELRPVISPNLNFMGQLLKYDKNRRNGEKS